MPPPIPQTAPVYSERQGNYGGSTLQSTNDLALAEQLAWGEYYNQGGRQRHV